MSKALDYLLAARPEAMGAYFQFLKEAETHLDTRTRDLISVITKVAVQTDAGFRHYLKRALSNGASPDEVLDALLMAFPVLGLAKIVWATDILLDMGLEEFRPENLGREPVWHDIVTVEGLPAGEPRWLKVDEKALIVLRNDEGVTVYEALCPHEGSPLFAEDLEGGTLACQHHGWEFDLASGACIAEGDQPLKRVETREVGGTLQGCW